MTGREDRRGAPEPRAGRQRDRAERAERAERTERRDARAERRDARRPGGGRVAGRADGPAGAQSGRVATARRRPARAYRLLGLSSTRRAVVLALVVCAVVLSVAVPLRNYLAQRGALQETVRQQENLREQVDGLERRKAQLSDPAQVEVEARERLRYVRPGETPYVVQLPTSTTAPPPVVPAQPTDVPRAGGPWYGELWDSIATGGAQ